MSKPPIEGLQGAGKSRGVSGDPRPEETPITPGNLACYDMDSNGTAMPEGIWEFDGNGKVPTTEVTRRVMEHEQLLGQFGPVQRDASSWVAQRNGLTDPDEPIPDGQRISVPVHELKAMLRLLEPRLRQALKDNASATVQTATGAHAQVTGNVASRGMPLLLDD